MENFNYSNPVKLLFGKGQLANIGEEIKPYGNKILLVYGKNHIKENGVYDKVIAALKSSGISHKELSGVHPNPRVSLVREGVEICKKENIDFILGIGGGSTSDTVKAIGMGACVDYDIWQAYEDFHNLMHGNKGNFNHVPEKSIPIGIVMTKPGTGSDFDYTSVLSNHETKEKLMVINKVMYAKFAIIDPELAYTLPKQEQMYGVADIMTHILEQYFSTSKEIEILDGQMEAMLRSVIKAGFQLKENSKNYSAQSALFYSASWACSDKAMCGVVGGWDSHMIEHEISALSDLNHGHGMAIVMNKWMKFMSKIYPEKFAQYATEVWNISKEGKTVSQLAEEGIEKNAEYWRNLGITLTLKENNINSEHIAIFAKKAVRFGPLGVLHALNEQDVLQILQLGE